MQLLNPRTALYACGLALVTLPAVCSGDAALQNRLVSAAAIGDLKQMEYLIKHGADPSLGQSITSITPLDTAVQAGQIEAVRLLLTKHTSRCYRAEILRDPFSFNVHHSWRIQKLLERAALSPLRKSTNHHPHSYVLTPTEYLTNTDFFSIGPSGFAGTTEDTEIVFRWILEMDTWKADLNTLVSSSAPVAQLYGLLGLKIKDPRAYAIASVAFRRDKRVINLMRGCIVEQKSVSQIVKIIDSGEMPKMIQSIRHRSPNWDAWISKPGK